MTAAEIYSQLNALIAEEMIIADQLLALMEEEPKVLGGEDTDSILTFTQYKKDLAAQLEEKELGRCNFLAKVGLPVGLSTLEQVCKSANATETATACRNLKQIVTTCAEYNRNNAVFVERRMRYLEQVLAIITGRNAEVELRGLTYGGQRNRIGQRGNGRSWAVV